MIFLKNLATKIGKIKCWLISILGSVLTFIFAYFIDANNYLIRKIEVSEIFEHQPINSISTIQSSISAHIIAQSVQSTSSFNHVWLTGVVWEHQTIHSNANLNHSFDAQLARFPIQNTSEIPTFTLDSGTSFESIQNAIQHHAQLLAGTVMNFIPIHSKTRFGVEKGFIGTSEIEVAHSHVGNTDIEVDVLLIGVTDIETAGIHVGNTDIEVASLLS